MEKELLKRLIDAESTPAFVFDVDRLYQRVEYIKEKCGNTPRIELCYAMKANPFLIQPLNSVLNKFEVCSHGELCICKDKNIRMEKVVLSGVNKERQDILQALEWGVRTFTIESLSQLELMDECTQKTGTDIHILLRLSSGNQFGMDRDVIERIIEQREEYPHLSIEGIQYYSGTQKKESKVLDELSELDALCGEIEEKYRFNINVLEYGPGFGVEFFSKEDTEGLSDECAAAFCKMADKRHLTLETGRFLTADCGFYITSIVDVKQNAGQRYCIVDGGINHVNYYGQVMGVRVPPVRFYQREDKDISEIEIKNPTDKKGGLCICGSLCTSADVLVRNINIEQVNVGDIFVFEKIGAYSVTEGIYLFLSRRMPKIYLLTHNELILARDTVETYQINQ
ncbi:MAG: alanine racemase [Lachnospiraceae bacterium]|nr:alanine racemase [Lachnospiraceae bacterium]